MKIVNILKILKEEKRASVATQYLGILQPMYVYHTTDELNENEKDFVLITNQSEYYEYLKKYDMLGRREYLEMPDKVFIKTIDRHIPTYTDDAEITYYEQDENGQPIPTDGVYVRIYKVHTGYQKHFVYTSSGIWSLGLNSWRISGGVKKQFSSVTRGQGGNMNTGDRGVDYKRRLKGIMEAKKTNVRMVRLVHVLTDVESQYFWNPEKAVAKIFSNTVRKEDRLKIIQSNAFRKVLMDELKIKNPKLVDAIRKEIDPGRVAKFISQALVKSEEADTAKGMLENIEKVIALGYDEDITNAMPGQPRLDPHSGPKELEEGAKEEKPEPTEDEKKKKEQAFFDERRESLDYPSNTVYEDDSDDNYVPIKLDENEE
jgi:hypothetical protein